MKYLPVIWTGLILSSQLVYCNEIYQSVRIFNPSPATILLLTEAGIPLDHITGKAGVYLDIVVSESQVEKLDSIGVEHKILIQYNDYIKGNRTNTNTSNKTPKFIENKNKMSNKNLDISNLSGNNKTSYFIQPQKLLSFVFVLLLVAIAWITIANISENNYKKNRAIFDNTKLIE